MTENTHKGNLEFWHVALFCSLFFICFIFFVSNPAIKSNEKNEFSSCNLMSWEKTGKKSGNIKLGKRSYEVIKTWECRGNKRLQVVWE